MIKVLVFFPMKIASRATVWVPLP